MENLFLKILNMSITAGWLVLAVLLMRLALKKAPRYLTVIMWALVGIRLVLPFSFESVLSLIPSAETVPPEILYETAPEIQTGIPVFNSVVNPVISESFAPNPGDSVNLLQVITFLAGIIWIIGMAGMAVYTLISYLRIWRRVREAAPLQENIWICDRIDTPFILGILRPRIYLPSAMAAEDVPFVLAHEQAHLKRKDHLWKPLGFLLLTVYWFNPLLWLAYILLCRDIETACDEKVLKTMGEDIKKPYSMALVNCSVPRKMVAACPLAFGEVSVKSRIKGILHYKKPAFWLLIAAVVVCIVLSVCFLTNPRTVDEQMQIFLDCQIADHFQTEKSAGNACCLDYEILGTKKKGKTTTVYMWVLYEEYGYQNGQLQQQTGSHIPTVITATKVDGNYRLVEYWEPRDGAYNPGDIKDKFPIHLWPKAMDSQRYIDRQKEACLEMAEQYFKENPPGLDSSVPPPIIEAPGSLQGILDYSTGLIDSTIFDIDGDGKAERCELHYGPTSGIFTFILAVYENETLEYCSCYTDDHGVVSFAQKADGTIGIHYASPTDATASGFYELKIVDRNIKLFRDGSKLISWCYQLADDLNHFKDALEDRQKEYELLALKQKYPLYFDLPTDAGLTVCVWQHGANPCSWGLLPGGAGTSEMFGLKAASLEDICLIVDSYDLHIRQISVLPIRMKDPDNNYQSNLLNQANVEQLFWSTYGSVVHNAVIVDIPTSTAIDTAVFDIDNDGKDEICTISFGPTSGLFTFVVTAYENGQQEYRNIFLSAWGYLSFVEKEDGTIGVCRDGRSQDQDRDIYDIVITDGQIQLFGAVEPLAFWGPQGPENTMQ